MSLPASESFTGSAAVLANPPWVLWASNVCQKDGTGLGACASAGVDCIEIWSTLTDTFPNDQYSQYTAKTTLTGAGTEYIYLVVRASGSGGTKSGYWFWTDGGSDGLLVKEVGGVSTTLATVNATTCTAGDIFKLQVVGTTITVTKNGGAPFISVTDASLTSGQPGMGGFTTATTLRFDNWIADSAAVTGDTLMGTQCL